MSERPHVLLVCTDHWPAELFGGAGHPTVHTPSLDELALCGTRYTNCYSECPVCVPAAAVGVNRLEFLPRRERNWFEPRRFSCDDPHMRCLLCLCVATTAFACLNDTAYKTEEQRFASEYQREQGEGEVPVGDRVREEPEDHVSRYWLFAVFLVVAAEEGVSPEAMDRELEAGYRSELLRGRGWQAARLGYEERRLAAGADLDDPDFFADFLAEHGRVASDPGRADHVALSRRGRDLEVRTEWTALWAVFGVGVGAWSLLGLSWWWRRSRPDDPAGAG